MEMEGEKNGDGGRRNRNTISKRENKVENSYKKNKDTVINRTKGGTG